MADVSIKIHGQTYTIACDDGEEERVRALGEFIDQRLHEIARMGAATTDSHLLVLTSLVLADELFEHKQRAGAESEEGDQSVAQNNAQQVVAEEIQTVTESLSRVARKIDSLALDIAG